jgi:hypothetical protein
MATYWIFFVQSDEDQICGLGKSYENHASSLNTTSFIDKFTEIHIPHLAVYASFSLS